MQLSNTNGLKAWLGRPQTFWVLVSGTLLLRLVLIIYHWQSPLVSDALYYDGVANALAGGYDFEPYWPPGLPHYLAGWKVILGTDQGISRLAMLPWFFILLLAIRSTLRQLSSNLPANLAVLVMGIFPAFVHNSIEPLSQLPAAALIALAFDQYLRFREHRGFTSTLLAGLFLALAVLFRPSCLLLALAWPLWCARRRPRFALAALPVVAIAALTISLLSQRHQRMVFFNDANARNFYLGNNEWTDWYKTWYFGSHWIMSPQNPPGLTQEIETIQEAPLEKRSRAYNKAALKHIRQQPEMFALRTASRVRTFFVADTLSGARMIKQGKNFVGYLTLIIDGLFYLLILAFTLRWFIRPPRPPRPLFRRDVLGLILLFAAPYFISFSHPTYHFPLLPLWIALAVLSGANWWTRKQGGAPEMGDPIKGARWWRIALAILLLFQIEWILQMAL